MSLLIILSSRTISLTCFESDATLGTRPVRVSSEIADKLLQIKIKDTLF